MITRNYSVRDVEMLMASRTIASNFLANISELEILRTNWDENYANALLEKIDSAMDAYLGMDRRKELKDATSMVLAIKSSTLRNLSSFKIQVRMDFPAEASKILRKLGYPSGENLISNFDQESLIQLLYTFKKEMTEKLKEQVCSKGINPDLISNIVHAADELKHYNTVQETFKTTTKQVTGEVVDNLNAIYHETVGICKIARAFYFDQPLAKEHFVFEGIVKNLGQPLESESN